MPHCRPASVLTRHRCSSGLPGDSLLEICQGDAADDGGAGRGRARVGALFHGVEVLGHAGDGATAARPIVHDRDALKAQPRVARHRQSVWPRLAAAAAEGVLLPLLLLLLLLLPPSQQLPAYARTIFNPDDRTKPASVAASPCPQPGSIGAAAPGRAARGAPRAGRAHPTANQYHI